MKLCKKATKNAPGFCPGQESEEEGGRAFVGLTLAKPSIPSERFLFTGSSGGLPTAGGRICQSAFFIRNASVAARSGMVSAAPFFVTARAAAAAPIVSACLGDCPFSSACRQ